MNDNAEEWCGSWLQESETLDTALRMFAAHGFSAASRACDAASIADKSGDDERSQFWLEVCRTLDRRLAKDFAQQLSR
ncbi:hypothetical protein [Novosphingobium sp.]|uniref:hypothetical protein n=1 Tax=Novosphingobium sp. TaxID=1874826 RepID=UPI003564ADE8